MTYSFKIELISFGFGKLSRVCKDFSSSSSLIISLQRSTHSSHIKTDGPAISLFTSFWFLPQKEQKNDIKNRRVLFFCRRNWP